MKLLQGDLAGADADLSRGIQLDPNDVIGYDSRSQVRRMQGDLAGALADINRAIELNPRHGGYYVTRAQIRNEQDDEKGAVADFDRAIECDPNSSSTYLNRCSFKIKSGDGSGALADGNRCVELDPRNPLTYVFRGRARVFVGDLEGAFEDFQHALELNPKSVAALKERGLVSCLQRQWKEALADWRQVCGYEGRTLRDPADACFYVWLIQTRLGETEAANRELAAYLAPGQDGKLGDWPSLKGDFLLGRLAESELFTAAARASNEKGKKERLCEAWFYAGMKKRFAGDQAGAIDGLRKCIATGGMKFHEYHLAKAELSALGAK